MSELHSRQGLHAYLGILAARVDSAPRMDHIALLMVDRYGEVHIKHSFLFAQVAHYATV